MTGNWFLIKYMEETFINIKNVSYVFEENNILKNVNFAIQNGKIHAVIGPNGGGKTILLKLIGGIYDPTSGDIEVIMDGKVHHIEDAIHSHMLHVGFVFEHGGLISNMTVYENIALPLRYYGKVSDVEIKEKVDAIMERLGLVEYSQNRPAQLSMGIKRRVNLAVAIANSPQLILYDNPTLGLDAMNAESIKALIKSVHTGYNAASVISTNNMFFTFEVAERVIFVDNNTVLLTDTPQNILNSDVKEIKDFLSKYNMPISNNNG